MQKEVLDRFFHAMGGDSWHRSDGWTSNQPLDEWYGIEMNGGSISRISLPSNGLTGEIPDEIGALTDLQSLDLRWNSIEGLIPLAIENLATLKILLLSGNSLSGPIPWQLGNLSALERLDVSYNNLSGRIPAELSLPLNLYAVGLHYNNLEGDIPWQFGNAANMRRLILKGNRLTGPIPPELGLNTSLTYLNLADNEFSGPIPWQFSTASHVELLDIRYTSVEPTPHVQFPSRLSRAIKHSEPTEVASLNDSIASPSSHSILPINGTELVGETTKVIVDPIIRKRVHDVMGALEVRNGQLHLLDDNLPEWVNELRVRSLVSEIKEELLKNLDSLNSNGDLERVFELYSTAQRIELSPSPRESTRFRASSSGTLGIRSVLAGSTRAGINCPHLKVHYPHESTGRAKAKASGSCDYVYGPPQELTYSLYLLLQKQISHYFFTWWQNMGYKAHVRRVASSKRASWSGSTAFVLSHCSAGTWRAQGNLYIQGSSSGLFYPFPGYYLTPPRYINC